LQTFVLQVIFWNVFQCRIKLNTCIAKDFILASVLRFSITHYLHVKTFSWQHSLEGTQQQVYWTNNNENQRVWTLPKVVTISLTYTRLPSSFIQTVNHKTEHLHPSYIKFCLQLEKGIHYNIRLNIILTYKHLYFRNTTYMLTITCNPFSYSFYHILQWNR